MCCSSVLHFTKYHTISIATCPRRFLSFSLCFPFFSFSIYFHERNTFYDYFYLFLNATFISHLFTSDVNIFDSRCSVFTGLLCKLILNFLFPLFFCFRISMKNFAWFSRFRSTTANISNFISFYFLYHSILDLFTK